jgi:hypothetical protein
MVNMISWLTRLPNLQELLTLALNWLTPMRIQEVEKVLKSRSSCVSRWSNDVVIQQGFLSPISIVNKLFSKTVTNVYPFLPNASPKYDTSDTDNSQTDSNPFQRASMFRPALFKRLSDPRTQRRDVQFCTRACRGETW